MEFNWRYPASLIEIFSIRGGCRITPTNADRPRVPHGFVGHEPIFATSSFADPVVPGRPPRHWLPGSDRSVDSRQTDHNRRLRISLSWLVLTLLYLVHVYHRIGVFIRVRQVTVPKLRYCFALLLSLSHPLS